MDRREVFEASVSAGVRDASWIDSGRAMFAGGRNGPYLDLESPVRNTAHWLATLSIGSHLGVPGARAIGHAAVAFLLSDHPFRHNGRMIHRQRHPKDWCNGVIGDAWVVEGLALAGRFLEHDVAAATALRLAASQPHAHRDRAWERVDPGGRRTRVDRTLNHQLWFAAGAAETSQDGSAPEGAAVRGRIREFLDRGAAGAFGLREDGTIDHHLRRVATGSGASILDIRRSVRTMRSRLDARELRRTTERDTGYHLYVLLALARLRTALPGHALWNLPGLRAALRRAADRTFLASLETNPYAYPYNAPGFGLPLISSIFSDLEPALIDRSEEAWEQQVAKTWDEGSARFGRGTSDGLTLAARVYELGLSFLEQDPLRAGLMSGA